MLGLEVSRLARNNADWHRLLEICALAGTLICDEDGLYDPADFNDRLLLGLKGTMSEAELHFIRARLRGGQLSKARRGELQMPLPVGLVYDPAGRVVLDPDTGVQDAIRQVFTLFARTGSARAVVTEFNAAGLLFPVRVRTGTHKGELAWMPLKHWRVLRTLHNPRYAGAFAYGRRRERVGANGKKTFEVVPRDQWVALIPDAHPGYIGWEQYEANQKLLLGNAQAHGTDRAAGPAREGPALLQGLAVCGRCGRRMTIRYHTRRGVEVPDYQCMRAAIDDGAPRCQTIPGAGVDTAIGQLLLDTLTPLALEVALTVQAELDTRAAEADTLRRQPRRTLPPPRRPRPPPLPRRRPGQPARRRQPRGRLERRAARLAGRPRRLRTRHRRSARPLSEEHKARVRALAADFPPCGPTRPPRNGNANGWSASSSTTSPWSRPTTSTCTSGSAADRAQTLPSRSPREAWQARQTHPDTLAALDRLLDEHTDAEAADLLNAAGHRSGDRQAVHRPDRARPTRQQQPAQPRRPAPRARTAQHRPRSPNDSACTPPPSRAWHRAGLLTSHQANDKNERLYEPPDAGDPRLVATQGSPIRNRVPTQPAPGGAI